VEWEAPGSLPEDRCQGASLASVKFSSRGNLIRENSSAAKRQWTSQMNRSRIQALRLLTRAYQFSVASGDVLLLESGIDGASLLRLDGFAPAGR